MTQERPPLVVSYGEHPHDAHAIKTLVQGLRPDLDAGRMKVLKSPPTLVKGIEAAKRRSRVTKVLATLRAVKVRAGLRTAIFHEDTDKVEPSHTALENEIHVAYAAAPCEVVAAVSAWELEAWWFLFPDAVTTVSASWVRPDRYLGRNVGLIKNAKEELAACVRPRARRSAAFREYREDDCEQMPKQSWSLASFAHRAASLRAGRASSRKFTG